MFDRLLLLGKGGVTLYFDDIGRDASTMIGYFESYGAQKCQPHENPAEWMLQVTGETVGSSSMQLSETKEQWSQRWQSSPQKRDVVREIAHLKNVTRPTDPPKGERVKQHTTPIIRQLLIVSSRLLSEQWRDPVYTYSKITLCISIVSSPAPSTQKPVALPGRTSHLLYGLPFMPTYLLFPLTGTP